MIAHHGFSPNVGSGVAPAAVPTPVGRHRKRAGRTHGQLAVGAAAVLIAALGIVAAVVWMTTAHHQQSADASVSASTTDADATDWIRANLPDGTKILTNGHAAPAGYPSASVDAQDQDWHSFGYLLTAPGTDPPPDATVVQVWQSSVPVAIFPTVQVRRIVQTPLGDTLRTREADRADRLVAGTALLSNPSVTASPQAQAVLTSGGLDLRAAATLTALAGAMPVYVANVEDVKAEAAAGVPARTMTVQVADAGRAATVISGMTAAFRAEDVTGTPDGTFRLHWPLRFAPLPSVN